MQPVPSACVCVRDDSKPSLFCSMQMGNTAAMLAAREGHEAVVALLEKAQVERTAGGGDKTSLAE